MELRDSLGRQWALYVAASATVLYGHARSNAGKPECAVYGLASDKRDKVLPDHQLQFNFVTRKSHLARTMYLER
ncbi:uncharacterized protein N7483_005658 [Penicillium malachiteum]|uniref:uncharacterized protein n=1 Tax=Penicillium malachiteum TaxID=1324776 RepID=UPI002547BFA4|nr:uncharacterized protein N7483_005658 [Penicillium malachiteum]KAJ5731150.1 hypothetical protein N7483_005658 [Penicillium malachiteum]